MRNAREDGGHWLCYSWQRYHVCKVHGKISTNHDLKSFKLKITKMVSMKGGSRSFKVVNNCFPILERSYTSLAQTPYNRWQELEKPCKRIQFSNSNTSSFISLSEQSLRYTSCISHLEITLYNHIR